MDELYGINVRGPDDIVATRTYPEAVEMAQRLNAAFAEHVAKSHHVFDPLMWAVPGVWLGTPESHAANLLNPGEDYAELVAAIRPAA